MIKFTPFQWSSFNFFGFYCAYGVLLPFLPVWLNHHGYDSSMIGLLIASGYLFRFLGAMTFSKRISHPNRLLSFARWLTWMAVATLFLVAFGVQSVWVLFPAIALFHIFNGGAMPIADTIASTWQRQVGMDYGKTRLFGSIAFVLGSISTGYLIGWLGESAIIGILIGWLVFLGAGLTVKPTQDFIQTEAKAQSDLSYLQLMKVPSTFKMLIAVSFIQASHAAYYAYSTIYWVSEGISPQWASLLWGLAVVSEILFFFFANRLFKTWKISHLMILSAVGAMMRWMLLASTTNISALMVMQLFHSVSYGAGHYAMIRYLSTRPTEQMAKLQALYFSFASCIFMALFTFIAGQVYQISPTSSFWLMVLFALPAIFIVPKRFETKLQC